MMIPPNLRALVLAVAAVCASGGSGALAAPWNYTPGAPAFSPPSGYIGNQNPPGSDPLIAMQAAVSENPAKITLTIYSGAQFTSEINTNIAGDYDVLRKGAYGSAWTKVGTVTMTTSANATWADTDVVVGQLYEYGLRKSSTPTAAPCYGFLLAGIKADQTLPKGRMAVVVGSDVKDRLPVEYAQYKADLRADGWTVHEIVSTRAKDYFNNGTGANDVYGYPQAPYPNEHINIRNQIIALNGQYPGELKNVVLVGKVISPRSGTLGIAPDGHDNVAAVCTDAYYADLDGVWPDLLSTAPFTKAGSVIPEKDASHPDGFVNNADYSVTLPTSMLPVNVYYTNLIKTYRQDGATHAPFNASYYTFTVAGGRLTNITSSYADAGLVASSSQVNEPGDNKFDPNYMSELTPNPNVELGFGRIDFGNNVPGEYDALKLYFNKLHRYKSGSPDFQVGRRAALRSGFGIVARNCLAAMPGIVGMSNIDFLRTNELPAAPAGDLDSDTDALFTKTNGPYIFYFKGTSGPGYSDGSKAMIWTGMQSHWGYWFNASVTSGQNAMQKRAAEDNFTLSYTWSIGNYGYDTSYLYHRMGMGLDTGDMMRISISGRGTMAPAGQTFTPVYARAEDPMFMEHIGDPALRLFMFAPASALSVVKTGGTPALSWVASPEPTVVGYHVYRAASADGPFTRLTGSLVAGTNYTDTSVSSGSYTYMVRAVRLESTGGGTFYNASLGVSQGIDLSNSPATLQVPSAALADAAYNSPYAVSLAAQGGTPTYQWTLVGGTLPPGLTLAPNGLLGGTPTAGGTFVFTVQATDKTGQTAQGIITLTALSNNALTLYPEANQFASTTANLRSTGYSLKVAGPAYYANTYLRYDLNGVNLRNGLVRARLQITASDVSNPLQLKVGLTADSADGWTESNFPVGTVLADNPNVPSIFVPGVLTPFGGTVEVDVTPLLRETLASDSAKKLGLHLFTTTAAGFAAEAQFVTRFGPPGARPRLIIETTNAPLIAFQSPTVNPIALPNGAVLQVSATATPIPANAGSLLVQWSKVSGPGTVTFSNPFQPSTTAKFSAPGDYILRLSATDGVLQSARDLTVRVLNIPTGTAPAAGPTGSLLRLALDESGGTIANDVAGLSPANSGTLTTTGSGGTLGTWTPAGGRIGGSLSFDGTGQRVEVPDSTTNLLDGMQKLTVSMWVKLSAVDANNHALLSKRATTSTTTTSYMLELSTAAKVRATVKQSAATGSNALTAGQWNHVLMTFDGSTSALALYLNGLPEASATATGVTAVPRNAASKLLVGDYIAGAASTLGATYASFNGQVDEVRVYDRVLTGAEIQDLYSAAPAGAGALITLANTTVSANAGQSFSLSATVSDPNGNAVALGWTTTSGPASVTFGSPAAATTTATAPSGGQYVLRLMANNGQVLTSADVTANITATLTAYQQWLQANGYPTNGTGGGAPDANPTGDGINNALKYALGLTPSTLGYQGRLTTGRMTVNGNDYLTLTYVRPDPAPGGAAYAVETSSNLAGWSAVDTVGVTDSVASGLRTITVRDSVPISSSPATRFIRLSVTVP